MPRVITKVTEDALTIAQRVVEEASLSIPREVLRGIIESDATIVKCTRGYPATASGFDTYDRDYLFWGIAKHLGFADWPCNGSPDEEYNAFRTSLVEAGYLAA